MGIGLWELKGPSLQRRGRRRSSVFIDKSLTGYDAFDRILASMFIYHVTDPEQFCTLNAGVAAKYGRYDYQRILSTLSVLLTNVGGHPGEPTYRGVGWGNNPMAKVIEETCVHASILDALNNITAIDINLYLLRRTYKCWQCSRWRYYWQRNPYEPTSVRLGFTYSGTYSCGSIDRKSSRELKLAASPSHSNIHSVPPTDYFSLRPRRRTLSSVQAHVGRIPPPITISTPPVPNLFPEAETASPSPQQSPTTASGPKQGGTWSSILNPRLLISGASEVSSSSNSPRQPQSNRSEPSTPGEIHPGSIPVPSDGRSTKVPSKSPRPPKRMRYQWTMTSSLSGHAGPTEPPFPRQPPLYIPSHALAGRRSESLPRSMMSESGSKTEESWSTATSTKVTVTFALLGNPQRHMTTAIPQERDRRPGGEPKRMVQLIGFGQTPPGDESVVFVHYILSL
jgi:hypothetical protein